MNRGQRDFDSLMSGSRGKLESLRASRQPIVAWVVHTMHDATPWRIIVEPDAADQLLVVITAYAVSR